MKIKIFLVITLLCSIQTSLNGCCHCLLILFGCKKSDQAIFNGPLLDRTTVVVSVSTFRPTAGLTPVRKFADNESLPILQKDIVRIEQF